MKRIFLAAALAASLAAFAQSGPGPGPGGPGGPGPRYGADNVPGWSMMTPEERKAHQEKMRGMGNQQECMAYMNEHHQKMQARAKEKGQSLPSDVPVGRGCQGMKK